MTTTSTSCPVCGRAVDPLRARDVAVKDGKVIAYCSAEHKLQAEGTRTPSRGVPTGHTPSVDSGPVIEIIQAKSAPVTTRSSKPEPEPAPEPAPAAAPPPKKRATTRPIQPPEDYDDSDLGPANDDESPPTGRSPVVWILVAIALAAVAAAVAFGLK